MLQTQSLSSPCSPNTPPFGGLPVNLGGDPTVDPDLALYIPSGLGKLQDPPPRGAGGLEYPALPAATLPDPEQVKGNGKMDG